MSTDPTAGGPAAAPGGVAGAQGEPNEADRSEIDQRAAYEAELSRITSADLMLQAAVSLLNVGSYRLAPRAASAPGGVEAPAAAGAPGAGRAEPPSTGDLEQARDAIDGARALLEILERSVPSEIAPLRNALSQLQIAYARAVQAVGGAPGSSGAPPGGAPPGDGSTPPSGGTGGSGGAGGAPGAGEAPGEQRPPGPGPAESSGRLWVPGR
ncbi:MAG TPA: hypothetical protein VK707_10480 [Solirubrobacteraceae bacterium]|jgi:hypothetical protein|nr:hypothetical protein [Solirubrobacteraceae bacterium]